MPKIKPESYTFCTDTIAYNTIGEKSEKKYYVTGYISVPEIDAQNELITPSAMKSMLRQLNEKIITIDYDHEAWREDNSRLPVAKIVESKIDERGLWVKAILNKYSPKFKDLWGSIKEGFVNAFSIAFKPLKSIKKKIGDTTVQLIQDLDLLNVAFTGAPVNKGAILTNYGMKSVMLKALNDMEVNTMSDEQPKPDAPAEEAPEAPAAEEAPKDEASVQEKAKKKLKQEDEDEEEEDMKLPAKKPSIKKKSEIEELTAQLKSIAENQEKLSEMVTKMKSNLVFKSKTPEEVPEVEQKSVDMLNMIR